MVPRLSGGCQLPHVYQSVHMYYATVLEYGNSNSLIGTLSF